MHLTINRALLTKTKKKRTRQFLELNRKKRCLGARESFRMHWWTINKHLSISPLATVLNLHCQFTLPYMGPWIYNINFNQFLHKQYLPRTLQTLEVVGLRWRFTCLWLTENHLLRMTLWRNCIILAVLAMVGDIPDLGFISTLNLSDLE